MRYRDGVPRGGGRRFLRVVVVVGSLLIPVLCQATEVTMILRQSPARGGVLRPEPGLHYYGANSQVFLAATANAGYEFICWLGDVGDPKANRTVVHLDRPKIIIALFERVEYNTLFKGEGATGSGGIPITRGSLIGAADYSWATQSTVQAAGAGSAEIRYEASAPSTPAEPAEPGPPVPEPPIPEPATAVLLLAGGWFAFARHRINRHFALRRNHG